MRRGNSIFPSRPSSTEYSSIGIQTDADTVEVRCVSSSCDVDNNVVEVVDTVVNESNEEGHVDEHSINESRFT